MCLRYMSTSGDSGETGKHAAGREPGDSTAMGTGGCFSDLSSSSRACKGSYSGDLRKYAGKGRLGSEPCFILLKLLWGWNEWLRSYMEECMVLVNVGSRSIAMVSKLRITSDSGSTAGARVAGGVGLSADPPAQVGVQVVRPCSEVAAKGGVACLHLLICAPAAASLPLQRLTCRPLHAPICTPVRSVGCGACAECRLHQSSCPAHQRFQLPL